MSCIWGTFCRHASGLWRPRAISTAAVLSLLFVCEALGATYYVDKARGNNQNSGLSTSAAWASIGKANATMVPGDTVLVRAGTYDEIIEPYRSGLKGAPITYRAYPGETVTVRGMKGRGTIVAVGRSYDGPSGARSYIVVDGFTIRHIDPFSVNDSWTGSRSWLVCVYGDDSRFNVIRNCRVQGQGSAKWRGGREDGIVVSKSDYNTIENNEISGLCRLGIYLGEIAQYNTIRGNLILDCYASNINLSSSKGVMQGNLIENNWIDGSLVEDGIQFETRYDLPSGTIDGDSNRGVVIRNNVICNNAENCIDLKGAAYVVIENNIMYGAKHNNDGGLNPDAGNLRYAGAHTIMHGNGASSRNVIIRHNILFDGPGGIMPENDYKIYNNTILYNNRDYTGSNSSWTDSSKPTFVGIAAWSGRERVAIKNNIVGGHNAADCLIRRTAPTLEIDGNLYFNDSGARLVDYRDKGDWNLVSFSQWPQVLSSQFGAKGCDVHSLQAAPLFVKVPPDPTGSHEKFDFDLQAGSVAIDAGVFPTQTTASGQGTTIPVRDVGYFFDGYSIVQGDTIQLAGQTATARIVSVDSGRNTLVVDKTLQWSAGQGVSLPYYGATPDIGAREYTATSTYMYTLQVSAVGGTVSRTPDRSSYAYGETVTLQATPKSGYTFTGWSGALSGTANPAKLVMNANKSVTANFAAVSTTTYTLTVSAANGTITRTPNKSSYTAGETVTLQATPNSGYKFTGWSGDLSGTINPATIVMNANKLVMANFAAITTTTTKTVGNTTVLPGTTTLSNRRAVPYTMPEAGQLQSISIYHQGGTGRMILAVYADGAGKPGARLGATLAKTLSSTQGWQKVFLQSPVSVSAGQKVWLAWVFENNPGIRAAAGTPARADTSATWSGGMPTSFGASTAANYIHSVYATYTTGSATSTTYTLTTSATNGTVTRTPNKTSYASGETVTLQATPNSGYKFTGWSGALSGTTNPATIVMNANKLVMANFAAITTTTTKTVGNTTVLPGITTVSNRRAVPYTMPEAGQLQSISIYHQGGTGRMILAVYADGAGKPGARLGTTAAKTLNSTQGWQKVFLQSPVPVSAGQKIWLAWVFENNPGIRAAAGTPARADTSATWSGGMPTSFGASTAANYIHSIYASY